MSSDDVERKKPAPEEKSKVAELAEEAENLAEDAAELAARLKRKAGLE